MDQNQLVNIEKLEADLWDAADNLRANSKLTAGEYCMPVLGVIFLRHATNRYNEALREIQADQASGKMPKRSLTASDFKNYLRMLNLPDQADPVEILSVAGGYRATDSFEVFPKIERREDDSFRCSFFLHGWRQVTESTQRRLQTLQPGEKLRVAIELNNPATQLAIQIQTEDYQMIGWAPRYLVEDFVVAIAKAPGDYTAQVVKVNPVPAPSKQRLLVELKGHWPDHEPMTTADFEPMVA